MTTRRERGVVITTLLVGYASFYLCRANLDAATPLLMTTFGYTKAQLGAVSSIAVLAYAVGKLVLGALGDVIGGRRVMLLAIFGSVSMTFAIATSSGLVALTALAMANRFFQAGGWSGLVHVVSRWFPKERHGTVMGVLSSSYELGNLLTLLLCGAIVRRGFGWRALFLVNPALFLCVGVFVAIVLRGEPPNVDQADPAKKQAREPLMASLRWLAGKPSFWLAVSMSMLLTFLRTGFNTWTPTYLFEVGKAAGEKNGAWEAIVKSAIFPAAGIIASLTAGRVSDRFGPGKRAPVMVVSLCATVIAILFLAHGGVHSMTMAALGVGVSGLFLLGPYSLLGGAITLDVAGTRATATATGIIDGVGYIGASLAGVTIGGVAQKYGWARAIDVLALVAAVAAALSAVWSVMARRVGEG